MYEDTLKQKVQKRIVIVSALILIGKFAAYYLTNSVGILTDALESIVNVAAGAISLYSLVWASKPKDKEHPFGHGKIELISASIEGILITIAGAYIIYEGIIRLFAPTPIQKLDVGIIIIVISGIINYIMGWYSIRIGKKYDSIALRAGGKHLQSDTYSTIGLVLGLIILYISGILWIDSLLALLFGSIIIATGLGILRKTTANLLDKADEKLLKNLADALDRKRQIEWIDIHNTKAIKYGSIVYIDCDLTLPWYYTIEEGHKSGNRLKNILQNEYNNKILISIHFDPCNIFDNDKCGQCALEHCQYRKREFIGIEKLSLLNIAETKVEEGE